MTDGPVRSFSRNRRAAPRFLAPLGGRAGRSPDLGARSPGAWPPAWVLCLALAACGGAQEPDTPQQALAHKAVDSERYSGVTEARTVVIADAAAWAALWEEHTREQDPAPRAPSIDFSQQMVLGVFAGQRPDSCSAVAVQKVYRANGRLVVEYAEPEPDPAASCSAVTTHPSQMVVVQRGPGPVDFIKNPAR